MEKVFRLGELFCGAGGLALGAKKASVEIEGIKYCFTHSWANDIDESACETYRKNIMRHNPDMVICRRVQDLIIEKLPPIDGLLFGFPCNDYSVVGEHRGIDGDYGPLYSYGVKVLNIHNPRFFLAENVSGLSSANDGKTFRRVLDDLRSAGKKGYRITPHLYKFEEYGVPQNRHRIIIIGIREEEGFKFEVPAPNHKDRYVSCSEELKGVEDVLYNNERTRHSRIAIERLKHIPPGGNAWNDNVPEHLRLNVKNCRLSHIYRRLHPDLPSYTLTGSGGGGTHVYHWDEPRALTNRERARLQTFDDDFIFYGSKESVRAQIGHAVPPRAAQIILEAVLKCFAGINYESVPAVWQEDNKLVLKRFVS